MSTPISMEFEVGTIESLSIDIEFELPVVNGTGGGGIPFDGIIDTIDSNVGTLIESL